VCSILKPEEELIDGYTIKSVIDRCYKITQIAESHGYVETRHEKGYVIVTGEYIYLNFDRYRRIPGHIDLKNMQKYLLRIGKRVDENIRGFPSVIIIATGNMPGKLWPFSKFCSRLA